MNVHHQVRKLIDLAFSPRYMTTKIGIGCIGMVGADAVRQYVQYRTFPKPVEKTNQQESQTFVYDFRRSIAMATGGLVFGVGGFLWYRFLDRKFPGRSLTVISKKLLCEAAIGPPILTAFYFTTAKLEGKSNEEWFQGARKNMFDIILVDWCCFLPAQAINFYFVSPKFRIVFVGFIASLYDYFLSYAFHR